MEAMRAAVQLPARARWAVGLLMASAAVAGLSALVSLGDVLSRDFNRDFIRFTGRIQITLLVATGVLWLVWEHDAFRRVHDAGRLGLTFTPGWAVGWWFVPFMNLVRVPAVMRELWTASNPNADATTWKNGAASPLIGAWFGLWIATNILGNIAGRSDSVEGLTGWGMVGDATSVAAAVLAVILVRRIEGRLAYVNPKEVSDGRANMPHLRLG